VLGRHVVSFAPHHESDVAEAARHIAEHPGALYYAKLATSDVEMVQALTGIGFAPVDVAVTLSRHTRPPENRGSEVEIAPALPEHHEAVVRIAATAFRWTRFHLDPLLPDELADRVKREWVRNCLGGGRGIGVNVAFAGGHVAGFLAVLEARRAEGVVRVIDLVAVHPDFQGKGFGGALVDAFIRDHGPQADTLLVGTQAANIGSIALYEKHGFRVCQTQYVLHLHAAAR
jgi:prepilin-type processing-associated H-X9-DG protein